MVLTDYFLGILTVIITFLSILLILYTFIRELQYRYKREEGVQNSAFEDISEATARGIKFAFASTFLLIIALLLTDPLSLSREPTLPATLAGFGLALFLLSVIIIFCAFRDLTEEEPK